MKYISFFRVMACVTLTFILFTGAVCFGQTASYKVKEKDVLLIRVLDKAELTTQAVVASDGTIAFPYIGTIVVKGLTFSEIEQKITQKLSEGFIKYPVVSVTLSQSSPIKFYTYGVFQRLGEIPYEENMTVLTAMSLAGGVTQEGYFGKVIVRRKSVKDKEYKDIASSSLNYGVLEDKKVGDLPLRPDDILIVERNKTFLIQGEVKKGSGVYVLEKDMTVFRAITVAGGISPDGLYGKVKLRRKQGGTSEYRDIEIDLKSITEGDPSSDIPLQPDDIIIVDRNKTFFILGEVSRSGEFVLEKDMTVTRAISVAGGVSPDGIYSKIKLRRKGKGDTEYKDILIDLKKNIEKNSGEDIPIEADDILIIERNKTYFVYGESNRPGEYILKDDLTVYNAISIAGGFTKWGSPTRVEIVRVADEGADKVKIKVNLLDILNGKTSDILLKPGDTIVLSAGVF